MDARLTKELALLRTRFPDLEVSADARWVLLPKYPLPLGWNATVTRVAFPIQPGHPATPPYSFCIPQDILWNNAVPASSSAPAAVPFPGSWRQISWTPEAWQPGAEPHLGSNLVQWALGFAQRFLEGA